MKRKKLLKELAGLLDLEGRKKRRHYAELVELLKSLKEEEAQLQQKILAEKDMDKRKRLAKELETVKAQHAKGITTLEDLVY